MKAAAEKAAAGKAAAEKTTAEKAASEKAAAERAAAVKTAAAQKPMRRVVAQTVQYGLGAMSIVECLSHQLLHQQQLPHLAQPRHRS